MRVSDRQPLRCKADHTKAKSSGTFIRNLTNRITKKRATDEAPGLLVEESSGERTPEHNVRATAPVTRLAAAGRVKLESNSPRGSPPQPSSTLLTRAGDALRSKSITSPAANKQRARRRKAEEEAETPDAVIALLRKVGCAH